MIHYDDTIRMTMRIKLYCKLGAARNARELLGTGWVRGERGSYRK